MTHPARPADPKLTAADQLLYAREIVRMEAAAVATLAERLDDDFCQAVALVHECRGNVIVTGMGKAGIIGQKLAATLASTGTRSHYLHPAEAVHGDLGRIQPGDVVLALSKSGETEEVVRLLPSLREWGVSVLAITGSAKSALGRAAAVCLELGPLKEACSLGLAPSTSTTAMLALGDALALVTSKLRGFGKADFAKYHPGGSLGRKLSRVEDAMRHRHQCRIAPKSLTVREVFGEASRPGRRSGAIMLVDDEDRLCGIFTDSDLARLFECRRDDAFDGPIEHVMTKGPSTVSAGALLSDAVAMLAERKISELPVIDEQGTPLGLIDITDLVGLIPEETV